MTRTMNLSNTQFKYQIVFFIHIYGYVWLVEGSPQVLPWQKMPMATFSQSYITMYVYEKDYLIPKL